jgi:hypothetical protein
MGTEIVPETSVSTCNQLTRLCAREDFIEFSRRESFKLYIVRRLAGYLSGITYLLLGVT